MRLISKRKYLLFRFYQETVNWPHNVFRRYLNTISVVDSFKGIQIADIHPRSVEDPTTTVRIIRDALELIERNDPRRFRRIQREVTFIVNEVTTAGGAEYHRYARRISIDLERYWDLIESRKEHYEWYIAVIAATFVHEATHGRIFSFHIAYTKPLRERIESLCCREEKRFASKLTSMRYDFANTLVADFDPDDWQESWKTPPWQMIKKYVKRYRGKKL